MRRRLAVVLAALALVVGLGRWADVASAGASVGTDLTVSADGHHLEQSGQPFFWMADTSYVMGCKATREEVDDYLSARKTQGFNVIKLYVNVDGTCTPNRYGAPFLNSSGAPNDAYFQHVDYIVDHAAQQGLHILFVLWQVDAATSTYLGQRYRDRPNVLYWGMNSDDHDNVNAVGRAVTGDTSLTWDQPNPNWSKLLMGTYVNYFDAWDRPWTSLRTYIGAHDAEGLYDKAPAKPVVWSDGHYEGGICEGSPAGSGTDDPNGLNRVSPLGMRRAAWIGFVRTGAFPTYGCPDTWGFSVDKPNWRDFLNSPGATDLSRFKSYWTARSWWRLRPDTSIVSNVQSSDDVTKNQSGASRSLDGNAVYAYLAGPTSATVNLSSITSASSAHAQWYRPSNGDTVDAGTVTTGGSIQVTTPSGWQDALLEVTAAGTGAAPAATTSPTTSSPAATTTTPAATTPSATTPAATTPVATTPAPTAPGTTTTAPAATTSPATPGGSTGTPLSSLTPTTSVSGWGPVEGDRSNGEQAAGDGRTLSLRGTTYATGLGVHADSTVTYTLPAGVSRFRAQVGVDDETQGAGSVRFEVRLDGVRVADSGVVTGGSAPVPIDVAISGGHQLTLVVTDGGDGLDFDHADWADARLT